jgi:transposase
MGEVTTVGLDIAKHVFEVHGIDGQGTIVLRRKVRRSELLKFFRSIPSCLVGRLAKQRAIGPENFKRWGIRCG